MLAHIVNQSSEKGVKRYGFDYNQRVIQEQREISRPEAYGRRLGAQHPRFQDIWLHRIERWYIF